MNTCYNMAELEDMLRERSQIPESGNIITPASGIKFFNIKCDQMFSKLQCMQFTIDKLPLNE